MTREPTTAEDEVLLPFETLARPSRYIRINGERFELADDRDFTPYQHGYLERRRRRFLRALGEDGLDADVPEEVGELALVAMREMMALLIPGAVGRTTLQRPKPTAEDPDPAPVEVPMIEALSTTQCRTVMELFTPPSAGASALAALVTALGALEPTIGDSQPLDSSPSTAPPPVAAVTG